MKKSFLESKTIWAIILLFIVGGLEKIDPSLSGNSSEIIKLLLGIIAVYGRWTADKSLKL